MSRDIERTDLFEQAKLEKAQIAQELGLTRPALWIDTSSPIPIRVTEEEARLEEIRQSIEIALHRQEEERLYHERREYLQRELLDLFRDYLAVLMGTALDRYRTGDVRYTGLLRRTRVADWFNEHNGLPIDSRLAFSVGFRGGIHLKSYVATFGSEDECGEKEFARPKLSIGFGDSQIETISLSSYEGLGETRHIPESEGLLAEFTSQGFDDNVYYRRHKFTFPSTDDLSHIQIEASGRRYEPNADFWYGDEEIIRPYSQYDIRRGGIYYRYHPSFRECSPEQFVGIMKEALSIIPAQLKKI